MRDTPGRATLTPMKLVTRTQRVILDAAAKASVIRGTLTAPSGARRDFHGWLPPTLQRAAIGNQQRLKTIDIDPRPDRSAKRNHSVAGNQQSQ